MSVLTWQARPNLGDCSRLSSSKLNLWSFRPSDLKKQVDYLKERYCCSCCRKSVCCCQINETFCRSLRHQVRPLPNNGNHQDEQDFHPVSSANSRMSIGLRSGKEMSPTLLSLTCMLSGNRNAINTDASDAFYA